MTMAVVAFSVILNTIGAKYLPIFEIMILILHVSGFVAVLVSLWVLAPKVNHQRHPGATFTDNCNRRLLRRCSQAFRTSEAGVRPERHA
jgi:hypothetical protein